MNEFSEVTSTSMGPGAWLPLVVLAVVLSITVYTELTEKRIPNKVTLPAMLLGLAFCLLPDGLHFSQAAVGFAIGFGCFFLVYMFGGMGGGDVKLMGVVGLYLGYPMVVPVLIYIGFIGAVMAVVMLIWAGAKKKAKDGTKVPVSIPYGVAIALGTIMGLMSGYAM